MSVAHTISEGSWLQLGTRVHGFVGGFIPAGIRFGLDAKERLHSEPRGISIPFYQGGKAPSGPMAIIIVRDRKTDQGLCYTISDEWLDVE